MGSPFPLLVAAALVVFAVFQARRIVRVHRRITLFDCGFDPNGRISLAEENAPATRALAEELEALGFQRLGVFWEQMGGSERLDTLAFAHPATGTFSSIFYLTSGEPRAFFLTGFEGGGAALTGAYERRAEHDADRILLGVPDRPLAAVLEVHAQSVETLKARSLRPRTGADRDARLAVARAWYVHPVELGRLRRLLWSALVAPGLLALAGLAISAWWAWSGR